MSGNSHLGFALGDLSFRLFVGFFGTAGLTEAGGFRATFPAGVSAGLRASQWKSSACATSGRPIDRAHANAAINANGRRDAATRPTVLHLRILSLPMLGGINR
jgi:hypothetical protein